MPIPASQIVQINPRLIPPGGTDLVINGLFLSKFALMPSTSPLLSFPDEDSVAAYFGYDSNEYEAAQVYFGGYDNSFKKPFDLKFGRRIDTDLAAFIVSSRNTTALDTLKDITVGSFSIDINSDTVSVNNVDFSPATSFSDVAQILQTALQAELAGVTVEYTANIGGVWVVTSPTVGADSAISYASGSIATALNLTEDAGGTVNQGADALSVDENMARILTASQNWVTFTTMYEPTDEEHVTYAAWASAQGVEFLYVAHSLDPLLINQVDASSIAYLFTQNNVSAATVVYGSYRYAAFICGTAASIDWNRIQGAITFAFKSSTQLSPTVDSGVDSKTLEDKTVNFYGNYATRNDNFIFLYNGSMFGDYNFIDPFVNAVWFNNAIQVAIMNGLTLTPRAPYNEDGYTLIRSWILDPINRALKNGVIDPGVVLSESQKAQVNREAGLEIDKYLVTDGYYLQVIDAGPQVRITRDSPNVSLWYVYGGSVQRIVMASTLLT